MIIIRFLLPLLLLVFSNIAVADEHEFKCTDEIVNPFDKATGQISVDGDVIDTFKKINCYADKKLKNHKSFLGMSMYELDDTRIVLFFQLITFIEYLALVVLFFYSVPIVSSSLITYSSTGSLNDENQQSTSNKFIATITLSILLLTPSIPANSVSITMSPTLLSQDKKTKMADTNIAPITYITLQSISLSNAVATIVANFALLPPNPEPTAIISSPEIASMTMHNTIDVSYLPIPNLGSPSTNLTRGVPNLSEWKSQSASKDEEDSGFVSFFKAIWSAVMFAVQVVYDFTVGPLFGAIEAAKQLHNLSIGFDKVSQLQSGKMSTKEFVDSLEPGIYSDIGKQLVSNRSGDDALKPTPLDISEGKKKVTFRETWSGITDQSEDTLNKITDIIVHNRLVCGSGPSMPQYNSDDSAMLTASTTSDFPSNITHKLKYEFKNNPDLANVSAPDLRFICNKKDNLGATNYFTITLNAHPRKIADYIAKINKHVALIDKRVHAYIDRLTKSDRLDVEELNNFLELGGTDEYGSELYGIKNADGVSSVIDYTPQPGVPAYKLLPFIVSTDNDINSFADAIFNSTKDNCASTPDAFHCHIKSRKLHDIFITDIYGIPGSDQFLKHDKSHSFIRTKPGTPNADCIKLLDSIVFNNTPPDLCDNNKTTVTEALIDSWMTLPLALFTARSQGQTEEEYKNEYFKPSKVTKPHPSFPKNLSYSKYCSENTSLASSALLPPSVNYYYCLKEFADSNPYDIKLNDIMYMGRLFLADYILFKSMPKLRPRGFHGQRSKTAHKTKWDTIKASKDSCSKEKLPNSTSSLKERYRSIKLQEKIISRDSLKGKLGFYKDKIANRANLVKHPYQLLENLVSSTKGSGGAKLFSMLGNTGPCAANYKPSKLKKGARWVGNIVKVFIVGKTHFNIYNPHYINVATEPNAVAGPEVMEPNIWMPTLTVAVHGFTYRALEAWMDNCMPDNHHLFNDFNPDNSCNGPFGLPGASWGVLHPIAGAINSHFDTVYKSLMYMGIVFFFGLWLVILFFWMNVIVRMFLLFFTTIFRAPLLVATSISKSSFRNYHDLGRLLAKIIIMPTTVVIAMIGAYLILNNVVTPLSFMVINNYEVSMNDYNIDLSQCHVQQDNNSSTSTTKNDTAEGAEDAANETGLGTTAGCKVTKATNHISDPIIKLATIYLLISLFGILLVFFTYKVFTLVSKMQSKISNIFDSQDQASTGSSDSYESGSITGKFK